MARTNIDHEFLNLHEFIKTANLKLNRYIWDYLVGGAETETTMARNRQALEMFLAPLTILPFDEPAAWAYGELRAVLERKGTTIGSLDMLIAAHALSQQALLVTNNTDEFTRVPGLQLDNWVVDA